jgi:hypothetical protein
MRYQMSIEVPPSLSLENRLLALEAEVAGFSALYEEQKAEAAALRCELAQVRLDRLRHVAMAEVAIAQMAHCLKEGEAYGAHPGYTTSIRVAIELLENATGEVRSSA